MKNSKVIMFLFVFAILLISILSVVHADDGSGQNQLINIKASAQAGDSGASANAQLNQTQEKEQERNQSINQTHVPEQERERNQSRDQVQSEDNYSFEDNGTRYNLKLKTVLRAKTGEIERELEINGYNVSTKLNLTVNNTGLNNSLNIRARLDNGKEKDVKVLPNVASQTAMNIFRNRNMTLVLKQVGNGTNASLAYEANSNQTVRLFGLFKVKANLQAMINAENGNVTEVHRPWWYFLASSGNGVQASVKTNSTESNSSENATTNSSNGIMIPYVPKNTSVNASVNSTTNSSA